VIYQDPLAFLLGLEGIALPGAWAGDHDRAFTDARLAEIRRLLDDEKLRDRGVSAERVSTVLADEQQSAGIGDWQDWPWSLMGYLPSATQAAGGRPPLVIWHFQLPAS